MVRIRELMLKTVNKLCTKAILYTLCVSLITNIAFLVMLNYSVILHSLDIKYKNIIINLGLLLSLFLMMLLFMIVNFIMKSIKDITQYTKILSDGKLDTSDIVIQGSNDFNMLAAAINNLKANLVYFLDQTKENILVLSDSIENVSVRMDTVFAENEEISSTIQEVASVSQQQLNVVTDTTSRTDEVKNSINSIVENIKEVGTMASDANLAAKNGKESLKVYNENINLISKSISDTNEFITELELSIQEINDIVNFIVGLSRQLNLLSLNASIEAEKSGEAGKGFAVVAKEITKLSNSTKEGTHKINSIITSILEGSDKVENSIGNSIKHFETGKYIFSNVEKIFDNISSKNTELLNWMNDINKEALNININIKDTFNLCKKVNEAASEVSESTEEVVALIEEELAEFQEINLSMSQLHKVLTNIEKLVTRFDLDIKPVTENTQKPLKFVMIIPSYGGIWNMINFGALYGRKVLKPKNTSVDIICLNSFTQEEYRTIIENCIINGCDGIVTAGFFEEQLQSVIKANIPIVTYNVDIKSKDKRIAYVGENSYKAGIVAAKTMIEEMDGRGKILIITSDVRLDNLELRKLGFQDAIKSNKNIEIVDILKVPTKEEEVYRVVKNYLKTNTTINGILNITFGVPGLARAIEESCISNNLKTIVFYDNTKEIVKYLDNGVITSAIGQDPFRQGYDSLIYLYNYLITGEKPDDNKTWTKIGIMDSKKAKSFLG
jgi:methyl-accepting chemotaxis protein/ABC-type sugar transport system substrate-binding protein